MIPQELPRKFIRNLMKFARKGKEISLKVYDLMLEIATGKMRVITKSSAVYWGDRSATLQHVEFIRDAGFQQAKLYTFLDAPEAIVKTIINCNIDWRIHICTWAASHCLSLEGDFVECGVWYGWLSRAICKYVDFNTTGKSFHFFDSWGADGSHEGYQADIFRLVKSRFSEYKKVYFYRGMVPRVLTQAEHIQKIAYLSLDMNGGIAEREALEFFWPKIIKGGIIYIDDYGWGYPLLRHEIDCFLADKSEKLLHFPCGSSIIIKS